MNLPRIAKHLMMTRWQVGRAFSPESLLAIEQAIEASELAHTGEICFAVEGALHNAPLLRGMSARERALDVFSELRVWDTEHNNGVLIYLLLADREVEIVADRGVHARVPASEWDAICRQLEAGFKNNDYTMAAINGIHAVTEHLKQHFPPTGHSAHELPDRPVLL